MHIPAVMIHEQRLSVMRICNSFANSVGFGANAHRYGQFNNRFQRETIFKLVPIIPFTKTTQFLACHVQLLPSRICSTYIQRAVANTGAALRSFSRGFSENQNPGDLSQIWTILFKRIFDMVSALLSLLLPTHGL